MPLRALLLAGFGLCMFVWLALAVHGGATIEFDQQVRGLLHQRATPGLTAAMSALTVLGSVAVAVPLIAAVLWMKFRRPSVLLLVSAGGAGLLDQLLKQMFPRPRPEPFFGLAASSLSSFPSGHALLAAALYTILAWWIAAHVRRAGTRVAIWTAAALLILGIGLSRIYLGVHYPTDVLAGYLAGASWAAVVLWATRPPTRNTPPRHGRVGAAGIPCRRALPGPESQDAASARGRHREPPGGSGWLHRARRPMHLRVSRPKLSGQRAALH